MYWLTETFISIVINDVCVCVCVRVCVCVCVLKSIHDTCTIQEVIILDVFDKKELLDVDYYEEKARKNVISKERWWNRMSVINNTTIWCIPTVQRSNKWKHKVNFVIESEEHKILSSS